MELGKAREAVAVGAPLRAPPDFPATRIGHHHIDLARAYLALDDRAHSLRSLEGARRANPDLNQFIAWLG